MHQVVNRGLVTSNLDPAKVGRIKVALATVDGNEYPEWIEPVFVPGWFSPPEQGVSVDLVLPEGADLVEFAHEIRYLGAVFEEGSGPPKAFTASGLNPTRRGYFTKAGHLLIFEDEKGKEEIFLSHRGTMVFALTNTGIFLGTKNAGENFVLGQAFKTLLSAILAAVLTHTHGTGVGPSGPPLPPEGGVSGIFDTLKSGVDAAAQLSDFIFGQKVRPNLP